MEVNTFNYFPYFFIHGVCGVLIFFDPFGPTLLSSYYNNFVFIFCVLNNLYQIIAHFNLGMGFGFGGKIKNNVIGANDDQSSATFILSTLLDYLGWVHLGYYSKMWSVFIRYLAYTHLSTGLMCFLNHKVFQETFIYRYSHWTSILKAAFVFTDSIVRTMILLYVFYKIINSDVEI